MNRLLKSLALAIAVTLAAGQASAQVKMMPYVAGAPKPVLPPKIMMIKPSQALRIAMQAVPGGKPLGVQLRGQVYIVKVKQASTIKLLRVNAASGALQ